MNQPIKKQIQDFREGDYIRGMFALRNKETPREYKNKSGGKFHAYQCPKCKGKIDFAQIKGVGEFSVHTNIVPKEAKKNE